MIAIEEKSIADFEKVLNNKSRLKDSFLLAVQTRVRSSLKVIRQESDEIPFEKWIMPPQEQSYIKCEGRDFL